MADIETANTIGEQAAAPAVYLKDNLTVATAWAEQSYLFAKRIAKRINAWDTCQLIYNFGDAVRQPGQPPIDSTSSYAPLAITGKFVRIHLNPLDAPASAQYWYGYILAEDKDRSNNSAGDLTGQVQVFQAVGLAYFLDRTQVRSSYIHDGVEIGRGLTFNAGDSSSALGQDRGSRANKHPEDDSSGLAGMRCFYDPQDTSSDPELWSATEILDHVLYYHGIKDTADTHKPARFVRGTGVAQFLDDWYPTVRTDRRSPKEILDNLANPQRGLCWWVEYDDDDTFNPTGSIYVHVQSLSQTTISLGQGSGGTLPANTDQESLSYDGDADVMRSTIGVPGDRAYRKVVCRGAGQTGTGTFGLGDSTLAKNWLAADQTRYTFAAYYTDGYSSLGEDEKKLRNDAYRRREQLAKVFSAFIVPNDWTGKVGDGTGAIDEADRAALFPTLTGSGTPSGQHNHYWPGLRASPRLAVAQGGTAPDHNDPESLPMVAIALVASSPTRYQLLGKLTDANFALGTPVSAEFAANYYLSPDPDRCGVRVRSTRIPHSFAKNSFDNAQPTGFEPEVDYQSLRCTLTIEADAHCEGYYPEPPSNVPVEELVIDMGDAYRLDYLAPNTVLGIGEGAEVYATPYSTGTVAVAAGVVTLSDGTFPDWAEDGVIRLEGINYTIDSRDSDTQVTLDDTGVTISGGAAFEISNPSGATVRDDRDILTDFARFAYEWYSANRRTLTVGFGRVDVSNFALGKMITTVGSGTGEETVNTVIGEIAYDFNNFTTRIRTIGDNLRLPELLT